MKAKNIAALFFLVGSLSSRCTYNDIYGSTSLKGEWEWMKTCGGIVGCVSASTTNQQRLIIDESTIREFSNGTLMYEGAYEIINMTTHDEKSVYELSVQNAGDWMAEVGRNSLSITRSFLFSTYKRTP